MIPQFIAISKGFGIVANKFKYASNVVLAMIAAVTFTIIIYVWTNYNSPAKLLTSGLLCFFAIYGITLLFLHLSKKKNDNHAKG